MILGRNLSFKHLFGEQRRNLDDFLFNRILRLFAFEDSIVFGLANDSVGL